MSSFVACIVWFAFISSYVSDTVNAQPYAIKTWATTIVNPAHSNHHIGLLIHYPSTTPTSAKTFPVMVFNHGWECSNKWYDYVWQNLVPLGYIVALPGDFEHLNMNQIEFAAAQRYTLDWLHLDCNGNSSCPLHGLIGKMAIASGHSMGGGASILSIGDYNLGQSFVYAFDAAFTLSGCGGREVAAAAKNTSKPIFLMSGTHDCICPPKSDAIPYYSDVPRSTDKFLADIVNGTHCQFEVPNIVGFNECKDMEFLGCPEADHNDITPEAQHAIVNEYMTVFANATMYADDNSQALHAIAVQMNSAQSNGILADVQSTC